MGDPLAQIPWPVRTERLVLRRFQPSDLDAAFGWRSLPEVAEWIPSTAPNRESFAARYASEAAMAVTVMIEYDGAVIGDLMVRVEDAWAQAEVADQAHQAQAELGWSLHPAYGGRGFATEAVQAAIGLCFDDLGVRRIVAQCFAGNTASWRLMERVGMRRESHLRADALHRSGQWLDSYGYALLASEWRGVQR